MKFTDLGKISYEIQIAANSQEVYDIWLNNLDKVSGSKLIYASREPVGVVIPVDDWGIIPKTDAYPRSLYNSPNLLLLSDEIVAQMEGARPPTVKADVTIVLDSNVVEEIFRFVKGEPFSHKDSEEILNFLITEEVNFNYNFFILENAGRYYMKPGHAEYVYKKLYCIQFFDYLDKEKYLRSGQRTPTITEEELTKITKKKLFEIFQTDSRKRYIKHYLRLHYFIYLSLLKIVEIEFAYTQKPVEKKMEMLLEFMNHRLQRIFRRELHLALSYFKHRNSTSFLQKINTNCKEPLEKLSNIAWDMMIFRVMEQTATVETENGQVIPYFISFDKPTRELFDSHPLKGLIVYDENKFISILDDAEERKFWNFVDGAKNKEILTRFFTVEAADDRHYQAVEKLNNTPPRKFVRQLEKKVLSQLSRKAE